MLRHLTNRAALIACTVALALSSTVAGNAQARRATARPHAYPEHGRQASGTGGLPVLAFYYMWYTHTSWSLSEMSALPTTPYDSSSNATIRQQVQEASSAGITGFISSWWGQGSTTDQNFGKLQAAAARLRRQTGYHFASTIYFETDAPPMAGEAGIVANLRYILAHYSQSSTFFHWHGKPVIFIWDPLGQGRTLAEWAAIRQQVDPRHRTIWSAEGVSMSLLSVFDGIHLFSAGYWGIQAGNMTAVDQGFRTEIDAYNAAQHTHRIWAAGVLPGYNDTRVPGRTGTYIVPRDDGATYRTSWTAALASEPDWITITSFNEWFEGSMIEPGTGYGTLYLRLTHQFTSGMG